MHLEAKRSVVHNLLSLTITVMHCLSKYIVDSAPRRVPAGLWQRGELLCSFVQHCYRHSTCMQPGTKAPQPRRAAQGYESTEVPQLQGDYEPVPR